MVVLHLIGIVLIKIPMNFTENIRFSERRKMARTTTTDIHITCGFTQADNYEDTTAEHTVNMHIKDIRIFLLFPHNA